MKYVTLKVVSPCVTFNIKGPTFGKYLVALYPIPWNSELQISDEQKAKITEKILENDTHHKNWMWLQTKEGISWLENLK